MVKVFFAETFQISFRSPASNEPAAGDRAASVDAQVSDPQLTPIHTQPNTGGM